MDSIKLPFTSELRGGGKKKGSFKIMTGEQLEKKINTKLKRKLKSGSLLNYVKNVMFPNTGSILASNKNKSNKSKKSIKYIKASETK